MAIERPSYQKPEQLELELALDEVVGLEGGGWVSPAEALSRELEAQRLFESGERPEWYEEYENLIYGGWPFRVAMYIAWASMPKKMRRPRNLGELASLMGLNSPRAIHTWKARNREIERQVVAMQAAPLFQHRADAFAALVESASNESYRNAPDRRIFFALTGDLNEDVNVNLRSRGEDLSQMSDEELAAMAGRNHEMDHEKHEIHERDHEIHEIHERGEGSDAG